MYYNQDIFTLLFKFKLIIKHLDFIVCSISNFLVNKNIYTSLGGSSINFNKALTTSFLNK